jgi:CHAT domain-containing protein
MKDGVITLDFAREESRVKVSAFEGDEKALRPYETLEVDWRQVDQSCREIFSLFNRSNRSARPISDIFDGLKKAGHLLFDLLIPSQAREKLDSTVAQILTLRLEDSLVHVPWELLYDGREFICRRFAVGRIASTRQRPTARSIRSPSAPFKTLIIADPRGDLEGSYREGMAIKSFLERRSTTFHADFKSYPVDMAFVQKNLRDYDIVHYAGHAKYDAQNPSESGWLLSDGTLKLAEIAAMGGFQPMPALVFSNACQSGRTDGWRFNDQEQVVFGLANAFLLSGVQHYIGTFCETVDEPSSHFTIRFYTAIAEGKTIGSSLREARQSPIGAGEKETLTWANYMLYGDPSREYRNAEPSGRSLPGPTFGRWKRIFQPSVLSHSVRSQPLLISLVGVAILTVGYGAYSRYDSGTPMPRATSPAQSAISVATVAQPAVTAPLSLSMNIIGQRREPDGNYTEVIVREGSLLRSLDHFQVHVETNRAAQIYVLLFDSQGQASQLFPDPKIEQPGFIDAGRRIAIPDKDLWFWLDEQPGTETVYVLASEEPMADIRELIRKMENAGASERKHLSGEIKQRIKIVERGVGGVAKGKTVNYPLSDGRLVQKITDVVAGSGAVVRAISFEHR